MVGWWLGAQRWYNRDKRNDESTFASINKGSRGDYAGVWEFLPCGENKYRIRLAEMKNHNSMVGWWLGAQRLYSKDKRNDESTFTSVHKGSRDDYAGVWE